MRRARCPGLLRLAPALCGLLSAGAHAEPRIDARLRARLAAPPSTVPATGGERFSVSVRLPGGAAALTAAGLLPREGAGEVAWISATRSELARITRLGGVRAIEAARVLRPSLDASVASANVPAARAEYGLDGRGAAVAVIDTGCDFRHLDFRGADGRTRFAAILDLATPNDGRHRELPDYGGAIWLAGEIQAQLDADLAGGAAKVPVRERDIDGHGTHVLGILGGAGRATGHGLPAGRYVGVAPAATLLCVKATRDGHSFDEADVITGVRFAIDRAAALGLPVAVNLSLSADGGPHDGTTALERALDALFPDEAPGRVLTVAAGNGGARDQHAGGNLLDGRVELPVPVPASASATWGFDVDLWFSGGLPAVSLVAPDGRVFGPVAPGHLLDAAAGSSDEGMAILDAGGPPDPDTGRREGRASLRGAAGRAPAKGTWTVVLDGQVARWDGWLSAAVAGGSSPRFSAGLDGDDRGQTPAFASSAIAVGSIATKNAWTAANGTLVSFAQDPLGAPSSFSATGPTADGRFFPDLLAPGQFIASSLSGDAPPDSPGSVFVDPGTPGGLTADDGVHGLLQGTSQAAPHVAGAAALLFQLDPTLRGPRIRELLRASARPPGGGSGYSPKEGFGRLDVAAAARLLRGPTSKAAADPVSSTVALSREALPPGAGTSRVSVIPRDAAGAPLGPGRAVTIEARDLRTGREARWDGPARDFGGGRYERSLIAEGPRDGSFTVAARVDGIELTARPVVWLVASRDEIGRPFAASSGCALGPRGRACPGAAALLAAALLVALAVGRRRWRR